MFDKIKKLFSRGSKTESELSEKDRATANNEPYVRVVTVNFDPSNPGNGYFELEWNQLFIQELLEAGYSGRTEEEIVDSWFTNLCRNIADEV